MSVVSTITVKGKTYTVTWAANQTSNPKNNFDESYQARINLAMIKPVIKDSKGKTVPSTTAYTVNINYLYISPTILHESGSILNVVKPSSSDQIGWGRPIVATATAVVKVNGVNCNIGTATLFSSYMGCVNSTTFRQRFVDANGNPVASNKTRLLIESDIDYYDPETEENISDNLNAFSATIQYRESGTSKINPWLTSNISGVIYNGSYNDSVPSRKARILYTAELLNTSPGKVYDVRIAPKMSVGSANTASTQKQWTNKKFTARALFNNVIAVGDELVAPQQDGVGHNLASLISGIAFSPEPPQHGFTSTTTCSIKYKNGAKIEDFGTLLRAIPKQAASKNTLLVVSIGMHNVLKVDTNKIISSAKFKALLKTAISTFLTNNPNATIGLFPTPTFDAIPANQTEQDALDELLADGTYQSAWNEYAPNILGSNTEGWVKDLVIGKLHTYNSAMIELCNEFATTYRKRVIMLTDITDPTFNISRQLPALKDGTIGYWNIPRLADVQINLPDEYGKPFASDKFHFRSAYVYNEILLGAIAVHTTPYGTLDREIADIVY
jgi:hypothetical protein